MTEQQRVAAMLDCMDVERVISVDDRWRIEAADVIAKGKELDGEQRQAVLTEGEAEILADEDQWRQAVEAAWDGLSPGERQDLYERALARTREPAEAEDIPQLNQLHDVFPSERLKCATFTEWKENREDLIGDGPVLVLFDLDASDEGGAEDEGVKLLTALQKEFDSRKAWGAVLTHTAQINSEHERWKEVVDGGADPKSTILISKSRLGRGDFGGYFRKALLAPLLASMMESVAQHLRKQGEDAVDEALAVDPHELETIVFTSSRIEGVWEPDNLLRFFALLQDRKVRSAIWEDETVRETTRRLRCFGRIPRESEEEAAAIDASASSGEEEQERPAATIDGHAVGKAADGSDAGETPEAREPGLREARKYQRSEIYAEDEFVNKLFMPVALGDVFVKLGGSKKFVVIGQPCDLMIRSDGQRRGVSHVELAPIKTSARKGRSERSHLTLPYFDADSGQPAYVDVSHTVTTRLHLLEPAAYRPDGLARLAIEDTPPEDIPRGWALRHQALLEELGRLIDQLDPLSSEKTDGDEVPGPEGLTQMVIEDGAGEMPFKLELDLKERARTFQCERVGRLSEPYATAVLNLWANYVARDALPGDISRER